MKFVFISSIFFFTIAAHGQGKENTALTFNYSDLRIIQRADSLLSDSSRWNRHDDRECTDDIAKGNYSLYCALYEASIDVTGTYVHRKAALEQVRLIVEKSYPDRISQHRLMDWNNNPRTTFTELKAVLKQAMDSISKQVHGSRIGY
jgi:hypothetical protein